MPSTVRSVRRQAPWAEKQDQGAALDPPRAQPLEPPSQAQGTCELCGTQGHSNFALTDIGGHAQANRTSNSLDTRVACPCLNRT